MVPPPVPLKAPKTDRAREAVTMSSPRLRFVERRLPTFCAEEGRTERSESDVRGSTERMLYSVTIVSARKSYPPGEGAEAPGKKRLTPSKGQVQSQ